MVLQYADSDDEHDGMMDTDEEVNNGRVTLFNGNGPPYFHGFLYMKGGFTIYYLCFLNPFLSHFKIKLSTPFHLLSV